MQQSKPFIRIVLFGCTLELALKLFLGSITCYMFCFLFFFPLCPDLGYLAVVQQNQKITEFFSRMIAAHTMYHINHLKSSPNN